MKTYRVRYCQRPHIYHAPGTVFVEADGEHDARTLAQRHAELLTRGEVSIWECEEQAPLPKGRVLDAGSLVPAKAPDLAAHIRAINKAWRDVQGYPDTAAEREVIEAAIAAAVEAAEVS